MLDEWDPYLIEINRWGGNGFDIVWHCTTSSTEFNIAQLVQHKFSLTFPQWVQQCVMSSGCSTKCGVWHIVHNEMQCMKYERWCWKCEFNVKGLNNVFPEPPLPFLHSSFIFHSSYPSCSNSSLHFNCQTSAHTSNSHTCVELFAQVSNSLAWVSNSSHDYWTLQLSPHLSHNPLLSHHYHYPSGVGF